MAEKLQTARESGVGLTDLLGGDAVPLVFRVHLFDGRIRWGVAKPTDEHDHGRAIQMLDGEGFGWWYPESSLLEAVSHLFGSGLVEDVEEMLLFANSGGITVRFDADSGKLTVR